MATTYEHPLAAIIFAGKQILILLRLMTKGGLADDDTPAVQIVAFRDCSTPTAAMRFLCLHGTGGNARVFEVQTAAIRHALGGEHRFVFLEGACKADAAPGIEKLLSAEEECLKYVDDTPQSIGKAHEDLDVYLEEEGPFDGVMAFSAGAALAASFILEKQKQNRQPFRCAIFFCAGIPQYVQDNKKHYFFPEDVGEVLHLPTAHIWGQHDELHPTFGIVLSKLCDSRDKQCYIHPGGHEIPGSGDSAVLNSSVKAIRRTINIAEYQTW